MFMALFAWSHVIYMDKVKNNYPQQYSMFN